MVVVEPSPLPSPPPPPIPLGGSEVVAVLVRSVAVWLCLLLVVVGVVVVVGDVAVVLVVLVMVLLVVLAVLVVLVMLLLEVVEVLLECVVLLDWSPPLLSSLCTTTVRVWEHVSGATGAGPFWVDVMVSVQSDFSLPSRTLIASTSSIILLVSQDLVCPIAIATHLPWRLYVRVLPMQPRLGGLKLPRIGAVSDSA